MPLSSQKFTVSNSDVLFLLPPEYPSLPPIGCYLNYPWNTVGQGDHHFTRQSYYGAPFLSEEGWYWYCVGLGGGFNRERWLNSGDLITILKTDTISLPCLSRCATLSIARINGHLLSQFLVSQRHE